MNSDRMFELAQALAAAKSRRDLAAAMKPLDTNMLLEAPAFETYMSLTNRTLVNAWQIDAERAP